MHDRLNLEQTDYQIPNTVSDLWLPNSKIWDENKIITLFGQQSMDALVQVPIIVGQGPDIICWKLAPNGLCSSESAYNMLAREEAARYPHLTLLCRLYKFLDMCGRTSLFNLESKLLLGDYSDLL